MTVVTLMLFSDVVSDVVSQRNAERSRTLLHEVVGERSRSVGAGPNGQPEHLEVFMRVPYVKPLASDTISETHRGRACTPARYSGVACTLDHNAVTSIFVHVVGSAKVPGAGGNWPGKWYRYATRKFEERGPFATRGAQ